MLPLLINEKRDQSVGRGQGALQVPMYRVVDRAKEISKYKQARAGIMYKKSRSRNYQWDIQKGSMCMPTYRGAPNEFFVADVVNSKNL